MGFQIKLKHFLILLLTYLTLTLLFGEGIITHLGSYGIPMRGRYQFFFWWQNWAVLLCIFAVPVLAGSKPVTRFIERFDTTGPNRTDRIVFFLVLASMSLMVHFFVLLQMQLTDDESAYRFTAQLLANGQMTAQSFPHKEFFERVFMINDGHFFGQYYYGWPFLLAIGQFIKLPFIVNSILYAGSACFLYALIRTFTSHIWALVGTCTFSMSPLMLIGSGTYLSQTSTTFLFVVFLYSYRQFNITNGKNATVTLPIMGFLGGALLLVRPFSAVLLCAPFVVAVAIHSFRKKTNPLAVIGFLATGALMCILFFYINKVLHGSILGSGYTHYYASTQSNHYVYSFWNPTAMPSFTEKLPPIFQFPTTAPLLMAFGSAFTRLAYDGVLLPIPFLLGYITISGFRIGFPYLISFMLEIIGYTVWLDLGIDSYGPVHLAEIVPLAILFFITLLHRHTVQINSFLKFLKIETQHGGLMVACALLLCSVICYVPIRVLNVHEMAQNIRTPYILAEAKGIRNAVIFTQPPFAHQKSIAPLTHFRYWRENPSIDLSDNIIWVNDFGTQNNQKLRELFSDRKFYQMVWSNDGRHLEFNRF